jgi:hypothetical protein
VDRQVVVETVTQAAHVLHQLEHCGDREILEELADIHTDQTLAAEVAVPALLEPQEMLAVLAALAQPTSLVVKLISTVVAVPALKLQQSYQAGKVVAVGAG